MSESPTIINPNYEEWYVPAMAGINMLECNKSSDVYKFIHTGKRYVIELPDSKTILNVECTYAAIRSADMKINSVFINAKKDRENQKTTVSYQYEHFDSIHYSSMDYREKCIVYISMDDLF
jgi:hypothetical protein